MPLGSGSNSLSLVDITYAAAGTELPSATPVLLGGSWWTVPDLCALARPQALLLAPLLALLLVGPSLQGLLRALCGSASSPFATNYGLVDVVLAVTLVALEVRACHVPVTRHAPRACHAPAILSRACHVVTRPPRAVPLPRFHAPVMLPRACHVALPRATACHVPHV